MVIPPVVSAPSSTRGARVPCVACGRGRRGARGSRSPLRLVAIVALGALAALQRSQLGCGRAPEPRRALPQHRRRQHRLARSRRRVLRRRAPLRSPPTTTRWGSRTSTGSCRSSPPRPSRMRSAGARTVSSTSSAGVSRRFLDTLSILLVFLVARVARRSRARQRAAAWSRPRSTRSRSPPSSTPTSSPPRAGSSSSRSPRSPPPSPRCGPKWRDARAAPGSCFVATGVGSGSRLRASSAGRSLLVPVAVSLLRVVAARVEPTGARRRRGSDPQPGCRGSRSSPMSPFASRRPYAFE